MVLVLGIGIVCWRTRLVHTYPHMVFIECVHVIFSETIMSYVFPDNETDGFYCTTHMLYGICFMEAGVDLQIVFLEMKILNVQLIPTNLLMI